MEFGRSSGSGRGQAVRFQMGSRSRGSNTPQLGCLLSSMAWEPLCRDTREEGLPVGWAVSPLVLSSDSQTFMKGIVEI